MSTPQKKIYLIIVSILALVIILWLLIAHFHKTVVKNSHSTGTTIVAFGDSLVTGYGSTPHHDFISLLSGKINQPIINLGKNGDTTADALNRIDDVLALNPKVVIVLVGGNDALQQIPIDQTFTNLNTIVTKIQASGAAVLILGVRGGLTSDPYASRFEQLAATTQAGYVPDVLSGLFGNPKYMSDTVHPNDAGYEVIAQKVAPALQAIL